MKSQLPGTILWLAGLIILAFFSDKHNFPLIALGYGLAFVGYAVLSRRFDRPHLLTYFLIFAFIARLVLLFSFPRLSDDLYRFLWDGLLILEGVSPLQGTPEALLTTGAVSGPVFEQLFKNLNSPQYHTVYPPIVQGINTMAAYFSGGNLSAFAVLLKIVHLLTDALSVLLIHRHDRRLSSYSGAVLWFALNPLLVVEGMGNLHYEPIAISFILLSFLFVKKHSYVLGGLALSAACLVKMHPLILLPLLFLAVAHTNSTKKALTFACFAIIPTVAAFALSFGETVFSIRHSIELYFNSFEFNASVYYLLRELGYAIYGYNTIATLGPALGITAASGILVLAWHYRKSTWHKMMEGSAWIYFCFLLLSTTVHPWYTLIPFSLALWSPYRMTFAVWTGLVVLSYSHYHHHVYEPDFYLIAIEYLGLAAVLIWQFSTQNQKPGANEANATP